MDWIRPFQFERMNETAVREDIIVFLLKDLGYLRDSPNNIIVEQPLRDPRISLGRKKPTDPILRGIADYILNIENRWRWVIEVKNPAEDITNDDRDQAWSYANHPEVKGLYFMVTNGRRFELYQTNSGPDAPAIASFAYDKLRANMPMLANTLSPASIKRVFPNIPLDWALGLGPGLRSFAKVVNGTVTYTRFTPAVPGIVGMINHLREGSVERSDKLIVASLIMEAPQQQANDMIKQLGLEKFQIWTSDSTLSSDLNKPNVFAAPLNWVIPRGTRLPLAIGGGSIVLTQDLSFESVTTATGILSGQKFFGMVRIDFKITGMPRLPPQFPMSAEGNFEMILA